MFDPKNNSSRFNPDDELNNSTEYDVYIEKCINLIVSISIKSDEVNHAINNLVRSRGIKVDESDPYSWKYYQNLVGEYHFSFKRDSLGSKVVDANGDYIKIYHDELMYVVSNDTQDEILLSKENLVNHPSTKQHLAYGTRDYYNLRYKYPDQEELIQSILYPIEVEVLPGEDKFIKLINKVMDAPNYSILSYDKKLVEDNEKSLVIDLNSWLKDYVYRWHVEAFSITDDLYLPSHLAILHLNMFCKLLNLRTRKCKTHEAHSFHVKQYLTSNHYLNRYYNFLTDEQRLWLYKNIKFIEKHRGSTETFEWLMYNIFVKRNIPIVEYVVNKLDKGEVISTREPFSLPESVAIPDDEFKDILMPIITKGVEKNDEKLESEEFMVIQRGIAENNHDALEFKPNADSDLSVSETDVVYDLANAEDNNIETKLLGSVLYNYNTYRVFNKYRTMIEQWYYLANHDMYNVYIEFKDPEHNIDKNITTLQAWYLMIYALYKSRGVEQHGKISTRRKIGTDDAVGTGHNFDIVETISLPDHLPRYNNTFVYRGKAVTQADLDSFANDHMYPVSEGGHVDGIGGYNDIVGNLLDIPSITAVTQFKDYATGVHIDLENRWLNCERRYDRIQRAEAHALLTNVYPFVCHGTSKQDKKTWDEFFTELDLFLPDYSLEEWADMANTLTQECIGITKKEVGDSAEIQKAMISLFKELSSYTIEIITTGDDQLIPIEKIGGPYIDVQLTSSAISERFKVPVDQDIEIVSEEMIVQAELDIANLGLADLNIFIETKDEFTVDVPVHSDLEIIERSLLKHKTVGVEVAGETTTWKEYLKHSGVSIRGLYDSSEHRMLVEMPVSTYLDIELEARERISLRKDVDLTTVEGKEGYDPLTMPDVYLVDLYNNRPPRPPKLLQPNIIEILTTNEVSIIPGRDCKEFIINDLTVSPISSATMSKNASGKWYSLAVNNLTIARYSDQFSDTGELVLSWDDLSAIHSFEVISIGTHETISKIHKKLST